MVLTIYFSGLRLHFDGLFRDGLDLAVSMVGHKSAVYSREVSSVLANGVYLTM